MKLRPWLVISVVCLLIGLAVVFSRPWQGVEIRLFDYFTVATKGDGSKLPITIVGIDEASFAKIGKRWPWPRDLHAKVLERIAMDGAAVIAFDVLFSERSNPKEDAAFAKAIKQAGNVVLSAESSYRETANAKEWMRVDPLPEFLESGAVSGLTEANFDSDAVMRRFSDGEDIFWRQIIAVLQRTRPELGLVGGIPQNALVRHLGPAHTFPFVPYHMVLDGTKLPPGYFQDQIVLIGRDVLTNPEIGKGQADLFATPFMGQSQLMTAGVELHATMVENALTGQALEPIGPNRVALLLVVCVSLAALALWRWHPLFSGVWISLLIAQVLGLSYWLFDARSQWLPVLSVVLTLTLMYLGMGMTSYLIERRRATQIKDTFSKYVAQQVVEQMVANPNLVRLGGERRELTLLFSDLAGFTSMSEKLSPEGVAHVINLYLTEMTRIIIASGGTVDKFIGDAVMAFWGAPLDDPQHARHGVETAVAMQQAMDRLQPQFAEAGVEGRVGLRIGLHTGPAIVGNMGSEERFDYTALGDTVNLASRLEGVNKMYGTRILFSAATADQLADAIPLRPVDRVRVKGKEQPVDIFTPCDDVQLIKMTEQALAPYRTGDWDGATSAWQAVAQAYPDDTLAPVFLGRIEEFRQHPPAHWDGSVALEKG